MTSFIELGKVINEARNKKEMSVHDFAKNLYQKEEDIIAWENGNKECPKELFVDIADLLDIGEYVLWNALQADITSSYRFDKNMDFEEFDKLAEIVINEFNRLYEATWEEHKDFFRNFVYPIFKYGELCEHFNIENKYVIVHDFITSAREEYSKNKLIPNCLDFKDKKIDHNSYIYTLLSMLTYTRGEEKEEIKMFSHIKSRT